jgi:hypothetical protein
LFGREDAPDSYFRQDTQADLGGLSFGEVPSLLLNRNLVGIVTFEGLLKSTVRIAQSLAHRSTLWLHLLSNGADLLPLLRC